MIRKIYKKLLRDWYAGLAMQADISRMKVEATTAEEATDSTSDKIAERSFEMADDMLKQRNGKKEKNFEGISLEMCSGGKI